MAMYSDRIIEEFKNPKNVGFIEDADGYGQTGGAECGDIMEMTLKIDENEVIVDAKFRTFGCGTAIASSSIATQLIIGKTVDEALKLKNKDVIDALGGEIPARKIHCSVLAEEAIKSAIDNYREKKNKKNN